MEAPWHMVWSSLTSRRQAGRDSFGTGQLLKDYLDRYAKVMDDRSERGMNNFKETMGTVLAGKVIGQDTARKEREQSERKEGGRERWGGGEKERERGEERGYLGRAMLQDQGSIEIHLEGY